MEVIFRILQFGLLFLAIGVAFLGVAGGIVMAIWWLIKKLLDWLYDLL